MNRRFLITAKPLLAALVLGVALSACDSTTDSGALDDPQLAQLSQSLSSELGLSAAQDAALTQAYAQFDHADRSPGFLWELAAEYQATLTDEQKAELLARTTDLEDGFSFRGLFGFPGAGGFYGAGGFFGGSDHHGFSAADSVLNLTDEQIAAFEEIHTRYRASMSALVDAYHAGTLTEDDFLAQMLALRTAKQDEIDAVLTGDQKAALETFRADREAEFEAFRAEVNAVRNDVLGLTDAQIAAMDGLYADQLAARESLYDQLAAGDLTVADFQAAIDELETTRLAELEALLDATSFEIVQIHDALTVRGSGMGHRGGMHGGRHHFGGGAWGKR
ncbi:MAG: hypothetical protein R2834_02230 [Rhodothermales bacterium]